MEGQRRVPTNFVRALVDELVPGRAAAQTAVAEAERARLASDLHAEVLPHLARAIARSERGASADELTSQLRDLETDLRALMTERRLVILEEFGLVPALEWLAEQTQDRFDVEVALDVEALDEERPPREVERAAFRIAQLALDNAVRHAGPSAIALATRCAPRQVALSVRDDGTGIEPEAGRAAASRNRAGLADMRVEADRVGGALDVHAARPGTEVTFAWAA
jgi:signal transduction histidine kinase